MRFGVLAQETGVHRHELGLRRFEGRFRLETAKELRHAVRSAGDHRRAEVMRAGHDIGDDLGVGRIGHGRLEHTDHCGGAWTETNGLADDGRIAVERSRPVPVGEDGRARGLRAVVGGVQQAAKHGAKAHDLEERPANHARLHDPGLASKTNHGEVDRGEITERADGGDA